MLLTGAGFISRILGFFYRIFLSQTIGASGLGLYQLIFPVFGLCLAISASGIQTAISRFIAAGKEERQYLYAGLVLSISLSGLLALIIYLGAPWIANTILFEPRTEALLKVLVLAFVPACIHACFNGYYYGRKNSTIPSACQLVEQFARIFGTLIIYEVLSSKRMPLEPIHAVWGLVISELAGLLFNLTAYLWSDKKEDTSLKCAFHFTSVLPALGAMAIPLTLNHVLTTLSHSLENLLLPKQLIAFGFTADEALGHFGILTGMALSVIFFPSAITNSLSVLLLPKISEANARGERHQVLDTIKGALCCGITLGSLCTFLFLFSGDWFGNYVFQNPLAGFYIKILSILCPFMYTQSLLNSIAHGLGLPTVTLLCNLSGCAIRIFSILILVPKVGMYAYIIAMILSAIVVVGELLLVVKRKI